MKIGVISDTHGSVTAWRKAYATILAKTDLIIHCGDILYHGPRNPLPEGYDPQALAGELNSLSKPLVIVKGNCDAEVDQLLVEYPIESPYAQVITPEYRIFAYHGHLWPISDMPGKITGNYQVIISGHTHLPVLLKKGNNIFLNPGSPALPKNESKTPSVAMIDNSEIAIFDLDTGRKISESSL